MSLTHRAHPSRAASPPRRAAWRPSTPLALRSLTLRLALLFFAIVLSAIAVVYLAVAPTLETSLRDQRLDSLVASARRFSPPIRRAIDTAASASDLDAIVRQAADASGARVTLISVGRTQRVRSFID